MRVQLTARHCDISDETRDRSQALMEKLTRYDPRLSAADVTFEVEKHSHRVEAVLHTDGQEPLVAKGEGSDFKVAVDQLVDRLGKRLRRRRSQVRDHQASRPTPNPEVVAE